MHSSSKASKPEKQAEAKCSFSPSEEIPSNPNSMNGQPRMISLSTWRKIKDLELEWGSSMESLWIENWRKGFLRLRRLLAIRRNFLLMRIFLLMRLRSGESIILFEGLRSIYSKMIEILHKYH